MAMRKSEIWPFVATWMELEGIMLREVSQAEKDPICFHSYADLHKLSRRPWRKGRREKNLGREPNHKRLLFFY